MEKRCPLLAQSRHRPAHRTCPLSGVKRTLRPAVLNGAIIAPPAGDCRFACPFPTLLLGRIVNARLCTFATDLFEMAHRQNDAWRVTHETGIARRHAISESWPSSSRTGKRSKSGGYRLGLAGLRLTTWCLRIGMAARGDRTS